jgi:hypothetical protein
LIFWILGPHINSDLTAMYYNGRKVPDFYYMLVI